MRFCLRDVAPGAGLFVPPAAGGRAVALKSRPRLLECLDCGRRASLTAGTAMHRSKLPLTTWFWAAHLMATHSNGMSARQLEDQLGVTYKTAWLLAQKTSALDGRSRPRSSRRRRRGGVGGIPSPTNLVDPATAGKILVVGAIEVIDRGAGRPKPSARAQSISTPVRVGCAWP